jgi:amino acid adenylation domain-containing protein
MKVEDAPLAGLTPEQRALLMLRMRQKAAGRVSREPSLQPVPRPEGGLPLSFAQQRLWFLDQWQPRNPAYNIPSATRLTGRLDVAALRGSLDEVVRRHESLRTIFVVAEADGGPLQVIAPPESLPMPMVDLAALPAAVREAEVGRLVEEEGERPFDLAGDRLVRATLLRCGPEEHVTLVTTHHIVSDGWSVGVFVGELGALYAARSAGRPSPLPELPVQYPDFAVWQRDWLRGEVLAEQLAYWMKTLAGAPPVTELPVSRPWPAVRGVGGTDVPWTIPPEQTEALKAVARREGATLFMALLAVLDTWLHRYSGATDLLVGTPVAGRNRAELEGLIGFFVNTLVMRSDLSGEPTFATLLARTREAAVGAQAHQDLPFEKLVEELRLERDPLRPLLVQVVLSFQNTPPLAIDLPGLQLSGLGTTARTARYDLLLSAREHGDEIWGYLEYSTDLFDKPAAERMVGHFVALLEGAAADPQRRLSDLPMLSAAERAQLAAPPVPVHCETRPLHRLFEAAVARNPHAVALSFEGREISYGDLDRAANRLAHRLRALGVGPEVRVGLSLERSPELIIGLLGILKAGGAYVPLDPDLPAERLDFLIADAGVRVVVMGRKAPSPPAPLPAPPSPSPGEGRQATEGWISHPEGEPCELEGSGRAETFRHPDPSGRQGSPQDDVVGASVHHKPVLVCLPSPGEGEGGAGRGAGGEGAFPESTPAAPANTAYVIYTSGSTGTPKGVVVRHGEVARLLAATQPWFGFGPQDVWTLFHSSAFDFSVWEIWGALAYGGRLVIVPFWVSRSPEAFHALLAAERVTVLNQTPSAFRQLVQWERGQSEPAALALRWVIFGGEALEIPSLAPWIDRHGDERPRLINMYGITETTVHVTFRRIVRADLSTAPGSLLGVPIPDLRVHLLDGRGEPVPDLVPGEICVGGDGVARGYLDRPDLTAERFVPDPWSEEPGARMYRAGDLARRLPDGDVQFLGRIDDQVKVRGFRIEPAEIEAVLRAHPAVAQAAVVAVEHGGGRRLVGFVVWKEDPKDGSALRRFAAERLPEALVPAVFVTLAELPLTANGKLDRKALARLETSGVEAAVAGAAYEPPATAVEEALAEVWAEALGVPRVGVNDSFFALGGDSILSLRVLAKARQRGIEVSLQQLFHHPTVRELARLVGETAEGLALAGPFALLAADDRRSLPAGLDDAYPLARLQAGMLFHSEQAPDAAVYHDVFSARLRAPFDGGKLRKTIEALTARHPVLRTSFALSGFAEPLQLVHAQAEVPFAIDDLRPLAPAVADAEIRAWLAAERHRAFAWNRPPLLRFHLHRLPSAPGSEILQLTLSFHHSVLDGWSAAALLSELFHEYLARLAGTERETPPPPPAFREFVGLERAALAAESTRAFWSEQVRDADPCLLPRWPVPAGSRAGEAVDRPVPISDSVATGLRDAARTAGVPLKSVLLAVHLKVMGHATGRPDPLTGLVANGRPEGPGSDEALGLFLNSLPFGLRLGAETWSGLARAAFEAEREMLPHRRFPLAEIQATAGGALFDTLFNFVHFHVYQGLLRTPGVELLDWSGYEEVDTPFGANFQLDPAGDRLTLRLSWRDRELDPRQVDALAGWYARALEAMATASAERHAEYSLLTAVERRQLLVEWGDGGDTGSAGLLIHELFEEQAARTPERLAVVDDASDLRLTYRELNDRAHQLARWLRAQGVGIETPVGLALESPPGQIVSFLAVLKAGGAYVPLDLTYPRERLARMVELAGVELVIADGERIGDLEFPGVRVVGTSPPTPLPSPPLPPGEGRHHPFSAVSTASPFPPLPAEGGAMGEGGQGGEVPRLAYVMFTSGSTGAPKAVAVEHRGVIRLVRGLFPPESVFLQISPVSFDAATEEIWGALLNGGCVVLPPPGIPSVDDVARLIARHGVTSMAPSTGLFHQIALARPEILSGFLLVSVGGDVMRPELANRVLAAGLRHGLGNGYGPTENTTHTTIYALRAPIPDGETVPLGRPIPGTRVAVLGADLQPVPLAVPGELYTGGEGLARGYLGRPDLTAERFVPDPFAELFAQPGARLYRTGDRVAWHPDGNLRFLGRIDRQIKVRGFRVEPGEVEAALAACPLVGDAVADVRDDLPGGRGLAAYLVPAAPVDSEESLLDGVRAFLHERLPDYLIPAVFLVLPALPLTVVGKVDRQALSRIPLVSIRREGETAGPRTPRTPVEEMLAAIWTEVLSIERPGLHDNFFDLGGHSLLAIQAVSRVRAVFGVEIPLPWLFDAPSIAGLAERIAAALRAEPARQAPPMVPRLADSPIELPLSFAQERLWFLEQLQPGTATYNIPAAVRLTGRLDAAALDRSLAAVVARHEALRTRFPGPLEIRAVETSPPSPLPSPPRPPGEGRPHPSPLTRPGLPFPPLPAEGGAMGEGGQGGEVPTVRPAQPIQVIDPPPAWVLPLVDLTALPAVLREETARALTLAEALRPFDLVSGPPLRALLVRTAAEEHLALLALHHIVSDGWSMGLLVREMTALYRAGGDVADADLPALPVQYADFALWQRQWLQGDVLTELLGFWRRRLAGAPPLLALPLDRPRPPVQAFHGDRRHMALGAETLSALESLGRRCGSTLFMTLLAVFDALLARWTGQTDVVVGVPSANRNRGEIENLIGFFVNSLVLRTDLAGDPGFLDLVGRVRETALAAFAHQDLPFEKLVSELRPDRDLSHTPLFQVLFQLLDLPPAPLELSGLTLDVPHEVDSRTAKFDLVLGFERPGDSGGGLFAEWRYNTELFDGTTVQRMADAFVELLAGILANPEQPFTAIPLLGAAARHQVLIEWNDLDDLDARKEAPQLTVPALFARQAARTPDAIAVSCEGRTMTYGELAAMTQRAARRLAARDVGPETVVALLAERGPDFLAGLVAILTAGGVYLPLDPSHPPQRLAGVLEQSTARWVIAGPGIAPPEGSWETISLADLTGPFPPLPAAEPVLRATNLAYILFTSGSTGRPKGAMLTHRGLLNHLRSKIADLEITAADSVAQNAGQTFDISIWQHLAPLLTGGRVEIVRDAMAHDPLRLLEAVERTGVSILEVVPSLLAGLLESLDESGASPPALPALRWLIPTGEALPPDVARGWLAAYPAIPLLNAYGPTECSDEVSHHPIRSRPAPSVMITPIGRPILNTHLYVIDGDLSPLPSSIAGELCVGGAGVGRGYLHDPARTAEVFVPDPFGGLRGEPGSRLYRTGDLARHLADGTLEYLGRRDHQVKIRGVRIETGEIAAVLAEHPHVQRAAVVARPQPGGGVALAAYVVLRTNPTDQTDPTDLRSFLHHRLPEVMVPSVFVELPELPLTANGKLDRRALPDPFLAGRVETRAPVAPRTPLEALLAELWAEALGPAPFGVDDNFFELGGDSIKGAVLIHRLQRRLGQSLYVAALFDAPTVASFAAYLEKHYPAAARSETEPPVSAEDVLALRRRIQLLPPPPAVAPAERNPPAVFILSPPRSGSTLLRVMLGGNPRLFAPPELELLSFDTLAERRAAFAGRNSFWLEGTLRALRQLLGGTADEARAFMEELEAQGTTTRAFYRLLQDRLQDTAAGRLLIDKTPSYALDPGALQRAESGFAEARYIHLVRHPAAVVRSFEEVRLDQVFFRWPHPFSVRRLAELIWVVSQENIQEFLAGVPAERQYRVVFEDLVREPRPVLEGICAFLGVPFDPEMERPYADAAARMTDGLHAESRMIGDPKFHQHRAVDAGVADRWREEGDGALRDLGAPTRRLAAGLGYTLPAAETSPDHLTPLVRSAPEAGPPPLSYAQERLWFLQQLEPEGSAYNMPLAFRMRGQIDARSLDRALVAVVHRHETLRTRFTVESGRPVPVLDPPPDHLLTVVDLTSLPFDRSENAARFWIAAEAQRPFDLESGPVVRGLLLKLSDQESAALFVAHHVACDGWSIGLWAQEVGALYRGETLPELPVQYGDFARWQRSWMEGTALADQIAWWRAHLAGLPPSLDLPADRPRPPIQTVHGASALGLVSADVAGALRSLGRKHGASPFMVLFAAFTILLHRLSGQDDIAAGSPIAGRTQPEVEGLIGCFLNTLVLRTDLSGRPAFPDLLAQVRATALGAYAHQDVPFEKLLEDLRPQRDLSRPSIFQVLFNMLNAPSARLDLPGLEIEGLELSETLAKFDLTLYVSERPDGLALNLVYNTDLFTARRMDEFVCQYRDLLAHIAERPDAPIDAWPLLTAEARAVLPDPTAPLSAAWVGAVHDLVSARAQRHPDRIALIDRAGTWTYGELDEAVNHLAAHLIRDGVRKGDRVAIHATRSAAIVWAVLGVLKSGAAFVILDPIYPEARLAEIVRLAEPRTVLRLDGVATAAEALARFPPAEPSIDFPEIGPADISSIAFTSGSTGVPKGILQTHGSMSHFIPWHRDVLGYGEDDRHTLLSGLAHDPLHRDMFYSLTLGATLCVPDPDRIGAPGYLAEWMREQRITVTNMTPAMAQLLTELPEPVLLPDLRCAVLAGDILTRRDVARVRRLAPQAVCINVYGATESQRALSWYRVEEGSLSDPAEIGEARSRQILPLGRGKDDVQLLILTGSGLAGIGEIGEIAIRSPHMAHGYLDDPEQTSRRFVANPFTGDPKDRVYLTGDLGRYLPDGAVAAAGRADQQVKIRGFRVEPGEIEAELGRLPGVREAVVVGKPARDGALETSEKRLVAYLVLTGANPPRLNDLRDALRDRLPAFMVPAVFVPLDRLPVNPNGKVDRRALPDPEDVLPAAAAAQSVHAPPRDEIELRLARIWEDVLETAPVGVTDDFFVIGGHSLLAVRLMARIAHDLGQTLPLAALFQATTIEELARLLRAGAVPAGPLVQLRSGGSLPPLFLIHPAGGQVPCYIDLARALAPGRPVWGLQDAAPIDTPRSLQSLAAAYLDAARNIHAGPWLLAGWSFGGRVAFEMARQLAAAGDDVAFLGMIDTGLVEPPQQAERSDADILIEALGPIPVEADDLRRAADPVALLVAAAQDRGLLPPGYDVAEARRLLALFKTHLEIARTDHPKSYPGRLTFFAAEETLAGWEGGEAIPKDHGWAALAAEAEVVPIPGNHVTLIREPENVRVLAETIDSALSGRRTLSLMA